MKLLGSLTSPFVRKARIVLAEKKIEYSFELDNPWDEKSRVPDANPLGKVPVLVLEDDSTLFDSRVIVEFLDSVSPISRLVPANNREKIEVKRWEALADGVLDAAVAVVLERRRPAKQRSEATIKRQMEKIERGLAVMSRDLADKPWCTGNAFTLADIACGVALGYLDFRHGEYDWRVLYPNLARLAAKLAERPLCGYRRAMPRGRGKFEIGINAAAGMLTSWSRWHNAGRWTVRCRAATVDRSPKPRGQVLEQAQKRIVTLLSAGNRSCHFRNRRSPARPEQLVKQRQAAMTLVGSTLSVGRHGAGQGSV
jgi:glutathione S-transferase